MDVWYPLGKLYEMVLSFNTKLHSTISFLPFTICQAMGFNSFTSFTLVVRIKLPLTNFKFSIPSYFCWMTEALAFALT